MSSWLFRPRHKCHMSSWLWFSTTLAFKSSRQSNHIFCGYQISIGTIIVCQKNGNEKKKKKTDEKKRTEQKQVLSVQFSLEKQKHKQVRKSKKQEKTDEKKRNRNRSVKNR